MSSDVNQPKILGSSKLEAAPILTLNTVCLIREFQLLTAQTKLREVCLKLLSH